MSLPTIKSRKRPLLVGSDEEGRSIDTRNHDDEDSAKLPLQIRRKTTSKHPHNASSRQRQTIGTRPITTLFSAANDVEERTRPMISKSVPTDDVQPLIKHGDDEDKIDDFSDNEGSIGLIATPDTLRASLDRRKKVDTSAGCPLAPNETKLSNGSQKFKMIGRKDVRSGRLVKSENSDDRPWAERFAPSTIDELVVHKRKISDVREWLETVYAGKHRQKLLILRGPAGAGKTATLSVLAQTMKLEVSEWKNPAGSEFSSETYVSMSASFKDFLDRTRQFKSLELDHMHEYENPALSPDEDVQSMAILEEFPSTSPGTSTNLQAFRSSVLQYLATSTMYTAPLVSSHRPRIVPVVMIITESQLTSTTSPSDSFTAHRLLGSDILSHPAVSVVDFNPVAPTFIRKALDMVIIKEARHSGRRRVPSPSVLEKLAESGDVRSAIGSLEFLCLKSQDHNDWGGRVAAKVKKGASTRIAMSKMEMDALEIITQRENSLGLFHAVGKVVYNKRNDCVSLAAEQSTTGALVQPPSHLRQHTRQRSSQVCVDKLRDETGTDTETFVAAIHENYVNSCEGSTVLDTIGGCLEVLSDGDILGSSQIRKQAFSTMTTESLRQEEIVFQVVVRGVLFALPDPVRRSPPKPTGVPRQRGINGDIHKMFYPVSMRLSRKMEEMEKLIDLWSSRLGTVAMTKDPYACNFLADGSSNDRCLDHKQLLPDSSSVPEQDIPSRTSLRWTRVELILERLPYMTKLEQAKPSSSRLADLEELTHFYGIDVLGDDFSDSDPLDHTTVWTSTSSKLPLIHRRGIGTDRDDMLANTMIEPDIQQLYLIEDDIEDS